jgi:hypothetical protein
MPVVCIAYLMLNLNTDVAEITFFAGARTSRVRPAQHAKAHMTSQALHQLT